MDVYDPNDSISKSPDDDTSPDNSDEEEEGQIVRLAVALEKFPFHKLCQLSLFLLICVFEIFFYLRVGLKKVSVFQGINGLLTIRSLRKVNYLVCS